MLRKYFILSIILLVNAQGLLNAQAVRLRCADVQDNGDVMLHWNVIAVGTGFYNYTLFHSASLSGPFTELAVITIITQDSYLHAGAGATNAPAYYYIVTNKDSGPSPPSDTLGTILLAGATTDNEVIDLTWTPLHTPLLSTMHPWYLLIREYPPGNITVEDSTQDLGMVHHFWACNGGNDTVALRIGVRDIQTGCISRSNPVNKVLRNLSNRFPPVIDSVSIDADGKAIIGWQPGTEPDIIGYTIFRVTTSNDSIDYADGSLGTYYTHQASDPCTGPLTYILLSVDSCGNESPFPFDPVTLLDKPHTTIFLDDVQYDPCLMVNTLDWNEYANFDPPLQFTRVFVSENGGPEQVLATIPPGQSEFVHGNLLPNTHYEYYVRAYSQDNQKTSTSCRREVTTYNSPRPAFMYIRFVTVVLNDYVDVMFYTDTSAHVQSYRILRGSGPTGPFEEVGTVGNTGQEYVVYSDLEADFLQQSYYYQVEVVDSCGITLNMANTSRSILLTVEATGNLQNILTWNAYESWDGGIAGYRVYRRIDDNPVQLQLADLGPSVLTYTDDVSSLTGNAGKITYMVEAYEGAGNPYGFQESSESNEALSEQESKFYVPNALRPYGQNTEVKPVSVFVGAEGYLFQVYNRWGQQVFSTTELNEGWNGTLNGEYVPAGVYVYIIRYRDTLNQVQVQKGNIAVIY